MRYTPKNRKFHFNYKIVIPILVLLLLGGYFAFDFVSKGTNSENEQYQICGFSSEKSKKMLEKNHKETYQFEDYLFYGESLALFQSSYVGEFSDGLSGKTIVAKDLCSDQEYSFVLDSGLDRKVVLNQMKTGFYELYVVDELKEKRLISINDIETNILTITRDNKNHKVSLLANQTKLGNQEVKLKERYAFLDIEDQKIEKTIYDIAIDPVGNNTDFSTSVSLGGEGNGLVEATESYKAAELLKTELENKGLKVLILRDENETIDTYGEDGRLEKAYNAKAKYYIRLGFGEADNTVYSGVDIMYSTHGGQAFGAQIIYDLEKKTQLKGSTIYMDVTDDPGVIRAGLVSGMDERDVYDDDLWIRETGGKATQAGKYSESSEAGTAAFAKDNLQGMLSLNIRLGYLTDNDDSNYWKENHQLVISTLADSILKYLGVSE